MSYIKLGVLGVNAFDAALSQETIKLVLPISILVNQQSGDPTNWSGYVALDRTRITFGQTHFSPYHIDYSNYLRSDAFIKATPIPCSLPLSMRLWITPKLLGLLQIANSSCEIFIEEKDKDTYCIRFDDGITRIELPEFAIKDFILVSEEDGEKINKSLPDIAKYNLTKWITSQEVSAIKNKNVRLLSITAHLLSLVETLAEEQIFSNKELAEGAYNIMIGSQHLTDPPRGQSIDRIIDDIEEAKKLITSTIQE